MTSKIEKTINGDLYSTIFQKKDQDYNSIHSIVFNDQVPSPADAVKNLPTILENMYINREREIIIITTGASYTIPSTLSGSNGLVIPYTNVITQSTSYDGLVPDIQYTGTPGEFIINTPGFWDVLVNSNIENQGPGDETIISWTEVSYNGGVSWNPYYGSGRRNANKGNEYKHFSTSGIFLVSPSQAGNFRVRFKTVKITNNATVLLTSFSYGLPNGDNVVGIASYVKFSCSALSLEIYSNNKP